MSKSQLHKRMTTGQVVAIMKKFLAKELTGVAAANYLDMGRTRFYELVAEYREKGKKFVVDYERHTANNHIDESTDRLILQELKIEKEKIIDNPLVPTKRYNYSYLSEQLQKKYGIEVSVPTIITRAKKRGFWKERPPKKIHDCEVITNYVGELIQHDSSHHLFAPDGQEKWHLITSIDDHSRKMLYADFVLQETTMAHISAVESVVLNYGIPLSYYADQHSIFRYVKDRDKSNPFLNYTKFTDDVDPQWKQVLNDCGIKTIYALSPQAKGKIERPYQWLQDHVVRTCVRENVTKVTEGREVLKHELYQYNHIRVHSTTKEIPDRRFETAIKNKQSLFRDWKLSEPFQSVKDIFCLRMKRVVDSYHKISLQKLILTVPKVPPRHEVELRMYPDLKTGFITIRFWFQGELVSEQKIKSADVPAIRF